MKVVLLILFCSLYGCKSTVVTQKDAQGDIEVEEISPADDNPVEVEELKNWHEDRIDGGGYVDEVPGC